MSYSYTGKYNESVHTRILNMEDGWINSSEKSQPTPAPDKSPKPSGTELTINFLTSLFSFNLRIAVRRLNPQ